MLDEQGEAVCEAFTWNSPTRKSIRQESHLIIVPYSIIDDVAHKRVLKLRPYKLI